MHSPTNERPIYIDDRERASGMPVLFERKGMAFEITRLKVGDYLINNRLVVERKTADDFVASLIANRLFPQCSSLMRGPFLPIMVIEGGPYKTHHNIDHRAIKGALVSVSASWQIPVLLARDMNDTVEMIQQLKEQESGGMVVRQKGMKPKRMKGQRLKFLQGLPETGPKTAANLLAYFGNIEAIIQAEARELQQVEGVGKKKAERIRRFIRG